MKNLNRKWSIVFSLHFAFILVVIYLAYNDQIPESWNIIPDYIAHFILFGLLGLFAHRALNRKKFLGLPLGTTIILLFAVSEEFLQILTSDRTFNWADMTGNIAGILTFFLIDWIIYRIRRFEPKKRDYAAYFQSNLVKSDQTAVVFGSTGLVGSQLVMELTLDNRYEQIILYNRKKSGISHPKITEELIDFSDLNHYSDQMKGTHLYCCLGTTIKKAGNRESFESVDYALPLRLSKIASDNGFEKFLVISSAGAHKPRSNFYLSTKAKMENAIQQFHVDIKILRPSILYGKREEYRFMESVGKFFMKTFSFLLIGYNKKYRGIHARKVAKAMIRIANTESDQMVFESDELNILGS